MLLFSSFWVKIAKKAHYWPLYHYTTVQWPEIWHEDSWALYILHRGDLGTIHFTGTSPFLVWGGLDEAMLNLLPRANVGLSSFLSCFSFFRHFVKVLLLGHFWTKWAEIWHEGRGAEYPQAFFFHFFDRGLQNSFIWVFRQFSAKICIFMAPDPT